jgi:hypothetical protein
MMTRVEPNGPGFTQWKSVLFSTLLNVSLITSMFLVFVFSNGIGFTGSLFRAAFIPIPTNIFNV